MDYEGFNPANGMVDELRRFWPEDARCLLISAFPDEHELDDRMRQDYENIVKDTGLSLSCMDICDTRNGKETAENLHSYDFVILGGGHVPTQNAFFKEIGLAESFAGYQGIVMGISAGTMNCARIVYAEPEMPGEATDPYYERFITGLGLTEFNILPHYNAVKYDVIDGLRLIEDLAFEDSIGRTFYAITDGSYLLQTDEYAELRGEAYMIRDASIRQICCSGSALRLKNGDCPHCYAVLVPWVVTEDGEALLLEVRSEKVRQPGEVCFPGGRIESGESAVQAAVRETCEELGVSESDIEIVDEREPLIMGDGRCVNVVEAVLNIDSDDMLHLSEDEVADVFLLPADWLKTQSIRHYDLKEAADEDLPDQLLAYLSRYENYRKTGETDYIEYDGHGIWGLTARIIRNICL